MVNWRDRGPSPSRIRSVGREETTLRLPTGVSKKYGLPLCISIKVNDSWSKGKSVGRMLGRSTVPLFSDGHQCFRLKRV